MAADRDQLRRLVRKADSVAESATVLVAKAVRALRGEIALLSRELNVGGSAGDRSKVEDEIRSRLAALSRRIDALLSAQRERAAKDAAKAASRMTGLEVRYSAKRAEAICELATPEQGGNLAAVFTDKMAENAVAALRRATVRVLRENAVEGGGMKEMASRLRAEWEGAAAKGETFAFTDRAGRTWDTAAYMQMNVRTNTMRVYNDCLADDIARSTGSDLVRVSRGGGDPHCVCHAWEGMVLSLTGKTKGLPTYEQAREAGCFHPNCVHTLEYVDEAADAEEVERAKAHPFDEGTDAGRRRREIEIARIREEDGLGEEEAKTRLDRADLAGAIRAGLVRADAEAVVAKMTDAQVRALSKGGTPPEFVPVKKVRGGTRAEPKYEPEAWNRGANGGVVHVRRDATAEDMSRIVVEKTTEDLMKALGHRRTDKPLGIDGVNPRFGEDRRYQTNCQRCVVVNEARERGYDVSALPDDGNWDGVRFWEDFYDPRNSVRVCANGRMFRRDLERKAAKDPDGSRYVVRIRLKSTGGGHFFSAYKTKNGIVYKDPQDTRRNAADHFLDAGGRPGDSWFMRVDNRMFAQDAKDAIS